ncbi:hypothetical protein, partial [Odoribacter splanchnicus]|uniref:hypothetical protein n=1 Tax=Odoribacter splanchnicus TaxID=28118 RepID=UPI0034A4FE11
MIKKVSKKYISAGSSNPIYYFKRRRSSYELPSSPIGDERSVPEFKKERKKVSEKDAFFFCYAARLLSIFIFKT